jgi:hypothetical protein
LGSGQDIVRLSRGHERGYPQGRQRVDDHSEIQDVPVATGGLSMTTEKREREVKIEVSLRMDEFTACIFSCWGCASPSA